jgi:predicted RNA-binding Zn ribbon-like protein
MSTIESVKFRGGRLCLDFVNTTNWSEGDPVEDKLIDFEALQIWITRKGLSRIKSSLIDIAEFQHLRGIIRRLVTNPINASLNDMKYLNEARAREASEIKLQKSFFALNSEKSAEWLLRFLADSTVELLLTVNQKRIKQCPGIKCGWIFIDESPNNSRRWCSMDNCGNRAKARRHYQTKTA